MSSLGYAAFYDAIIAISSTQLSATHTTQPTHAINNKLKALQLKFQEKHDHVWEQKGLKMCECWMHQTDKCKNSMQQLSDDREYPHLKTSLFSKPWPWHGLHIQYLQLTFLRTAITGVFCSVTGLITQIQMPIHHVHGQGIQYLKMSVFPLVLTRN